jgi:hypothetical protein
LGAEFFPTLSLRLWPGGRGVKGKRGKRGKTIEFESAVMGDIVAVTY